MLGPARYRSPAVATEHVPTFVICSHVDQADRESHWPTETTAGSLAACKIAHALLQVCHNATRVVQCPDTRSSRLFDVLSKMASRGSNRLSARSGEGSGPMEMAREVTIEFA